MQTTKTKNQQSTQPQQRTTEQRKNNAVQLEQKIEKMAGRDTDQAHNNEKQLMLLKMQQKCDHTQAEIYGALLKEFD